MRTDDLIDRLSGALEPVPPLPVLRVLALGLVGGAVVSALVMTATIGIRPDLPEAMGGEAFRLKFVYTFVVAAFGLLLVDRLARPDAHIGRYGWLLAVPVLVMVVMAANEMMPADAATRHALIMGHSARVCSILIAGLALPLFAGLFWALRRLAPTRLTEAGAAAGLLAGSAAATIYALHCTESTPTFIAIWYSAGILLTVLLGATLGRLLLRWS
ncbi:MAG TPA: DUF1109 domain-containing protein [Rhizomicrobium sp.]|nr:DUF1109 domain-containing protein [Rhizomicrobium sp.]